MILLTSQRDTSPLYFDGLSTCWSMSGVFPPLQSGRPVACGDALVPTLVPGVPTAGEALGSVDNSALLAVPIPLGMALKVQDLTGDYLGSDWLWSGCPPEFPQGSP